MHPTDETEAPLPGLARTESALTAPGKLRIINGAIAAQLVDYADAIAVTREMFVALHDGLSVSFPVAVGHGSSQATRFGMKAGYDGRCQLPGVKIGSYWPGNIDRGLPNHGSTTVLLDDRTGFPMALIEATVLNALRTAASDAVAVDTLARRDADTLALIGPGNQAYHDARAIALVRPLREILIAGRDAAKAAALADRMCADGLPARSAPIDDAVGRADIIVTATAARSPLFDGTSVRPGTHISAMGADGLGKQELAPSLVARASLFADLPSQSLRIGEFQHIADTPFAGAVAALGAVLSGAVSGRPSDDAITIYDSSGLGLQDIVMAALVLERAIATGAGIKVDF